MIDDRWAWVALALAPDVGWNARRYHDLLSVGSPAELFRAPRRALADRVGERLPGGPGGVARGGAPGPPRAGAEAGGARRVTLEDAESPATLRAVVLPPPFLLVRGSLDREDALAISIVGSRTPSPYG